MIYLIAVTTISRHDNHKNQINHSSDFKAFEIQI
jgi:hypothetical protein